MFQHPDDVVRRIDALLDQVSHTGSRTARLSTPHDPATIRGYAFGMEAIREVELSPTDDAASLSTAVGGAPKPFEVLTNLTLWVGGSNERALHMNGVASRMIRMLLHAAMNGDYPASDHERANVLALMQRTPTLRTICGPCLITGRGEHGELAELPDAFVQWWRRTEALLIDSTATHLRVLIGVPPGAGFRLIEIGAGRHRADR